MSELEQGIERRIAGDIAKWQRGVQQKGEPLVIDSGWLPTPPALRLPFSVLDSAGVPPHEVELLAQRTALRERLQACTDPVQQARLACELSGLEQIIAFRLKALQRLSRSQDKAAYT